MDGTAQGVHAVSQEAVLVLEAHRPLQLWVPEGHTPMQTLLLGMQAPLQSFIPVGHAGTHARPSQVTDPAVGA